jgi:hypothetical protein
MLTAVVALLFTASLPNLLAEPSERLELVTSERFPFADRGLLELHDTFGEVRVEGWNRPEVEITVRRATRREYPASRHVELRNQLENVKIVSTRRASRLVISTAFPQRSAFTRPQQSGKSDLHLEYIIRAPKHTALSIRHNYGDVKVVNVTANTDITGNTGEITLLLPPDERFVVDARCRIGGVMSDFAGDARRPFLVGVMRDDPVPDAHRLHVRLDSGGINIRRMTAETM